MSVEEGGDESLPAGLDAPTAKPSETLTYATPEEVVEFVERVRPRESQTRLTAVEAPTGNVTIVAVGNVDGPLTTTKCEWENCSSPSVGQWRWRREAADGVNDAFDTAVYCDGHGSMAQTHGAVLLEHFR